MPISPSTLHTLSTCASRRAEQRRQQLARELNVRQQIDPHQPVPMLGRHALDLAVVGDAGVVDQDVDAVPIGQHRRPRPPKLRAAAHTSHRRPTTSTPSQRHSPTTVCQAALRRYRPETGPRLRLPAAAQSPGQCRRPRRSPALSCRESLAWSRTLTRKRKSRRPVVAGLSRCTSFSETRSRLGSSCYAAASCDAAPATARPAESRA